MSLSQTQQNLLNELKQKHNWVEYQLFLAFQAGFRCEYCGKDMLESLENYEAWQIDHIIPQSSKRYSAERLESLDNKAVSCKSCNFIKGHWDELKIELGKDRQKSIEGAKKFIDEKRKRSLEKFNQMLAIIDQLRESKITPEQIFQSG